jgi:L-ribulose-5-phosphate 3-epimerase
MNTRDIATSTLDRRHVLQAGLAAVATAPGTRAADPPEPKPRPVHERICIFTDHLDDQGFTYAEVAAHLKQLGVAGPDLTVRPGGLVSPDKVADELPKAAAAFRDAGLTIPMVSTGLTSARDPAARATLAACGKIGIRYFKTGYYKYDDPDRWEERIASARKELESLIELGKEAGVCAGIHNHAGQTVGRAMWDGWELLKPLDAKWAGAYFDPMHATIEGGNFGWQMGFRRLSPRLKMVALKDFVWGKAGNGWRTKMCPLGEGMVRWPEFFRLLARVSFDGPLSLHIEYDVGGKTKAERLENALAAARKDLDFLRKQLKAAFGDSQPPK